MVHAFGYAWQISGDQRFRDWGDDLFSATYGTGPEPGSDGLQGLADAGKAKEWNQAYRSAGRYLGWRG